MRHVALVGVTLLAVAVAAGCNRRSSGPTVSEYETARQQLAEQQAAGQRRVIPQRAPTEAPPEEEGLGQLASGYSYDATGKRDPFRSFILEHKREMAAASQRGPLEQFELGQLSLVAVVWGTDRARALVQDPSGRAYVVEEGARIGKNEGEVVKIQDNLVSVRETYVDYLGERTTKEIHLRIRQSQGG